MSKVGSMKKILAVALSLVMAFGIAATGKQSVLQESSAAATSAEAQKNQADIKKTKEDISSLEQQQSVLDKKIKDAQADISTEQDEQEHINQQISLVEKTIQKYDDAINKYTSDIDKLTKEIATSEANIKKKEQEIEQGIEDFKKRIRVMYINGTDSYADIIGGSKDFYDMLMKLELVKRVADHDNNMIDNLVELKRQYEAEKKKLEANKKDLEVKKKDLETHRQKQEAQKEKLEGLYAQSKSNEEKLKNDEAVFLKNKTALAAEKKAFEADLQALYKKEEARKKKEEEERKKREEEERKRQEALLAQQQQASTGNTITNNSSQTSTDNSDYGYSNKSQFTWPVPGFYHISYGVGWRWGAYHEGIDIYSENIRGAKICAAAAGTVIRVENYCTHDYGKNGSCGCGGGYGNYCIIDHGNGYWTLYGHSEGIIVHEGQQVKQGDVLGTVGSTGYSTGPHLHFEVRINGVAQDPTNYV